jgi:hypothetical protein
MDRVPLLTGAGLARSSVTQDQSCHPGASASSYTSTGPNGGCAGAVTMTVADRVMVRVGVVTVSLYVVVTDGWTVTATPLVTGPTSGVATAVPLLPTARSID